MRISYLMSGFGAMGGSLVLYNFMDKLVERGYEVFAVLPDRSIKWESGIWKDKLSQISLNKSNPFKHIIKNILYKNDNIRAFRKINNIKKETFGLIDNWAKSDITISTFCTTAYAGYLLSDKSISLYHMQHFEEIFFNDLIDRYIARNTYFLPINQIANSTWLKNLIEKSFNKKPYLLNPGIDLKIYKPYVNPKEKYKEKNKYVIVSYVDAKREWKGFNDALKALKIVKDYYKKYSREIEWKLYGINPPITKDNTINYNYVGKVFGIDLAKLYSSADLVLVPSWYESFPLPPLEAMSCGTLVVTTKYGTEDYAYDNINSLVCLPRKIEDMANKIIYALENPKNSLNLVENALETVKNYSWDKRTDVLESIIDDCIKNNKSINYKLFDDLVKGIFDDYMYNVFDNC